MSGSFIGLNAIKMMTPPPKKSQRKELWWKSQPSALTFDRLPFFTPASLTVVILLKI